MSNPRTLKLVLLIIIGLFLAALAGIYVKSGGFGNAPIVSAAKKVPRLSAMPGFFLYGQPRHIDKISFVDGKGQPRTLDEWRGKVVLLNIWATWCPPCRAEMPTLNNLQKTLGSDDFEVIALSVDKGGPDVPRAFLKKTGSTALKVYNDKTISVRSKLGLRGYPTTLLIGRDGRELGRLAGPAEWDSAGARKLIENALKQ
ncbi:MAG TPA: TlpA family protein disulfide reductase [Rhodobacteraceae bacterium]|nr:TlpA family protein disulfide reductase [Paracoccaceae bacterium]